MRSKANVSPQSINSPLVAHQEPIKILSHQLFSLEFVGFTSLAKVLQLCTAHDRWKSSEKAANPTKALHKLHEVCCLGCGIFLNVLKIKDITLNG